MTLTARPPATGQPQPQPRQHRRRGLIIGAAAVLAGGLGVGLGVALSDSSSAPSPGSANAGLSGSMQSYYQSMMGRYNTSAVTGTGMMGGSSNYGWMMGSSGYGWMMGGGAAPGWMSGGSLPSFMMGTNTDPGKVMGQLFANAPGPRISPTDAAALGNQAPSGATVDRAANRITFTGQTVQLAVLASPTGQPDLTFRIGGLVNPTIVVATGAHVTIDVINADPDTAHGLVISAAHSPFGAMPMMTTPPTFPGAAVWFLGNPTAAGLHEATLSFTANQTGTYSYLCAVPNHAQKGMAGSFVIGP